LFGPETPPVMAGQPPLQPRAPDATGGYYQPLRADLDAASTIALVRLRCPLAGASLDVATEFAARYTLNQNPTLAPLTAAIDGQAVALAAPPAGRTVELTASWPPESAERYPVLDAAADRLIDHREALTVSWFASAGQFAQDRTGRGEDDPSLAVE